MSHQSNFTLLDVEEYNNQTGSNLTEGAGRLEDKLYDVPTFVIVILGLFYGLISLFAFVGNSLVIYVVIVSRRMKTVTNMYIANLAFADVTIALFAIPFQFHAALLQRWDLPAFMCQFCPTVQILSVNISIFTLVAISLDR
jgi:leucokinin receptor